MHLPGLLSHKQWRIITQTPWPCLTKFDDYESFFDRQPANSNLPAYARPFNVPQYALYIGDEFSDIINAPGVITQVSTPAPSKIICGFWLLEATEHFEGLVGAKEEFRLLGSDLSLLTDTLTLDTRPLKPKPHFYV